MAADFAEIQQCIRNGDAAHAQTRCLDELTRHAADARLWHLLGLAQAMQGNLDTAVPSFQRAVELDAANATYYFNLGLALKSAGQAAAAADAYRAAINLRADFFEAQNNLGNALMALGDAPAAVDCFLAILEVHPDLADVHFNLANLLQDTGKSDAAVAHYRQAIKLAPNNAAARENLGRAFADNERDAEAAQVWQEWLDWNPQSAVARHMLASLSGQSSPARCDDQYIRETFDESYARTFDRQLERLDYQAPQQIVQGCHVWRDGRTALDILDAGCGTGLCGPLLKPFARQLIGVDLSESMLELARQRTVYDDAIAAELTRYLSEHPAAYDLVVAADTVCYFGDLAELFAAAHVSLRDDGGFIFTVERLEDVNADAGYRLQRSGRYAHTQTYVTDQLQQASLALSTCQQVVLRKEVGRPVQGLLIVAGRRGRADE